MMKMFWSGVMSVALGLTCASSASAALLTVGAETQLEAWLGAGNQTFTKIFEKGVDGTTSQAFHTAVDGKGATFTLLEAVIGGGAVRVRTPGVGHLRGGPPPSRGL